MASETLYPSPPESSSSDDTAKQEGKEPKKESTGQYLENLAVQILDINLNQKNNSHPLLIQHMSPSFRGNHDALPKVNNRNDHQANLKKHLDKQPDFHVKILNHSSDVDESRGRATVYLWYEIHGLEHGLGREAVAVLNWERKQGNWMIIKHTGMRGPSGFW